MSVLLRLVPFIRQHKVPVFFLVLGLGLGIWLSMLLRPATGTEAVKTVFNGNEKKLQAQVSQLVEERAALHTQIDTLYAQTSQDSVEILRLRVLVKQTAATIVIKNRNIEKIRKQYETLNHLDSVSSDELVRLFSDIKLPETSPAKR